MSKTRRKKRLGAKVRGNLERNLTKDQREAVCRRACLDALQFRAKHDPLGEGESAVECVPEAERDGRGASHRTADTLDRLKARGTITEPQFSAGRRFERDFDMARLERLHAIPLVRVAPGAGDFEQSVYDARDRVHAALSALGDANSPIRSLAYQILAEGRHLKDCVHARSSGSGKSGERAISTGIFIASLVVLQMHYTERKEKKRLTKTA